MEVSKLGGRAPGGTYVSHFESIMYIIPSLNTISCLLQDFTNRLHSMQVNTFAIVHHGTLTLSKSIRKNEVALSCILYVCINTYGKCNGDELWFQPAGKYMKIC